MLNSLINMFVGEKPLLFKQLKALIYQCFFNVLLSGTVVNTYINTNCNLLFFHISILPCKLYLVFTFSLHYQIINNFVLKQFCRFIDIKKQPLIKVAICFIYLFLFLLFYLQNIYHVKQIIQFLYILLNFLQVILLLKHLNDL